MQPINQRHVMTAGLALATLIWGLLQATTAMAAGDWRPTYDIIMMWVNFVILATVLIKLLRQPLGNFLRTQRDAVKDTLETLENEKGRIEEEIKSLRGALEDRQQRAADLHERMVANGEEERRELIAEARQEAERRLIKARQLIEAHQREVSHRLRDEIIDTAVRNAMAELPKHITPEVEQVLTDRFLRSISRPQE
jgi:F-type H+-transporting ATPase subunit b